MKKKIWMALKVMLLLVSSASALGFGACGAFGAVWLVTGARSIYSPSLMVFGLSSIGLSIMGCSMWVSIRLVRSLKNPHGKQESHDR